ncbi:MFS general substrate transporter [Thozetella sp. PMI_491]|nr:MFS general substrate transporter [Thozetella sp. PMI_491]
MPGRSSHNVWNIRHYDYKGIEGQQVAKIGREGGKGICIESEERSTSTALIYAGKPSTSATVGICDIRETFVASSVLSRAYARLDDQPLRRPWALSHRKSPSHAPSEEPSVPSRPTRTFRDRILGELGLVALYRSPRDVKLLCLQRFFRLLAYGASTLVLVAFMEALGFSKTSIGLFMTLTLVGDVCISFGLTLFADYLGRKTILMLGAALMSAAGMAFALSSNYWVLLIAAIVGVISPSGNEIGPFRAVEESVIAHITQPETRSDIYAWYTLFGPAGTSLGLMICGWMTRRLTEGLHWGVVDAYRVVFVGYAVLGGVKFALAMMLSRSVELEKRSARGRAAADENQENEPFLEENGENSTEAATKPQRKGFLAALPSVSAETRVIMVKLCILFAVDSFASGLVSLTWITYFFRWKHHVDDGTLGTIFSATSVVSAISILVASSLARRFGNVNTMVFTHLPSDIFLALIPVPQNVFVALLFLFLRDSTKSMDTAPKTAFLAAILLPEERTALMGLVNVVRTTAQALGPLTTGILVDNRLFWVAFLCGGSIKAIHDLGLLILFKNHERVKETPKPVISL